MRGRRRSRGMGGAMTHHSEVYENEAGEFFVRCTGCGELLTQIQDGDEVDALASHAMEHTRERHV